MNDAFIEEIRSAACPFYRDLWAGKTAGDLPPCTREDLARVPVTSRRYKNVTALASAVRRDVSYVVEWGFEDLRAESIGDIRLGTKPLVYFRAAAAALWWSLWCYEHGIVPHIGERDPAATLVTANLLDVSAIITDSESVGDIAGLLPNRPLVLAGSDFDGVRYPQAHHVLWCIETGVIALGRLIDRDLVFTPLHDVVLEHGSLRVTKERLLVNPVIRFESGLRTRTLDTATFGLE